MKTIKRIGICMWTMLAGGLAATAQPRFASNMETYNFGQIEWKRTVSVCYTVTNAGDKPLVLGGVEPDCACTVARWTQQPIAPGEKGEVCVTFDAETLGHFHKSVAVTCNAEPHLVYLNFTGEVVHDVRNYAATHPYRIGDIRTDCNSIDFPDVNRGERPQWHISVVNESDRPYEPVLMHLPSYLQAEAKPAVLQKGERGNITLTLDSEKLTDLGLTQASVYLARFSGDKVSEENEIPFSVVLLPDFSALTEAERNEAPAVHLSASLLDMSALLQKKEKARQDIILTNQGKSPLKINKLQVSHPAVGVALKKAVLQPGESTRLRVTVTRGNLGKSRRHLRLLMITNDPDRPKVEILVKTKE